MNSWQIETLLQRNTTTSKFYYGCYSADQLPDLHHFPCCLVANTDPSQQPGSHWVAIFATSSKQIEYYDSLATWPPTSSHIAKFLLKFKKCKYNQEAFQSPISSVCGHHAIYFLTKRCQGFPYDRVMTELRKNTADRKVTSFVRYHFFRK